MYKKIVVAAIVTSLLTACATGTSKEDSGAIIGTVLGAALGSQLGKGDGRIAGALVGAFAGGMLGKQLGAYFDEQDRKRMEDASQKAAETGKPQVYISQKTGARYEVTALDATYREGPEVSIVDGINTSVPLVNEKKLLQTQRDTVIRSSPLKNSKIMHRLKRGSIVDVVATVRSAPWVLVAENDVAIGYIERSALSEPGAVNFSQSAKTGKRIRNAASLPNQTTGGVKAETSVSKATRSDPATGLLQKTVVPAPHGTTLTPTKITTAPVPQSGVKKVSLVTECRVNEHRFTLPDGKIVVDKTQYCRMPPKGMVPIRI